MVEGQPSRPANIENIVAINQGRHPLSLALPEVPAFDPVEAARLLTHAAGAVLPGWGLGTIWYPPRP